ncbi:MAG: DUF1343 domain-containing protein [Planctomycetota bacterium]|nr:MAG: DUF1343 domain-containing protein [Planctomycetota bacterium]
MVWKELQSPAGPTNRNVAPPGKSRLAPPLGFVSWPRYARSAGGFAHPWSVATVLLLLAVVSPAGPRGVAQDSTAAWRLPLVAPQEVGFDADKLEQIAALVEQGIADGKMPGCVICFGRQGKIAYRQAFGLRKVAPDPEAMTVDTVFDMASITKPVATATSVMTLIERGQLRLQDKVAKYFPEFGTQGKEAIRVLDLLIHQSGLIPDNPLADYEDGPAVAWQRICDLPLSAPVGQQFKYSDVNFIVLGKLVEHLSGQTLDAYARQNIFMPLGMTETGFLPSAELRARAAPTEKRDGQWIRGEVHDPRAFLLGGVAGHAGLFSTADDLALYAHAMLGRGRLLGPPTPPQILHPRTVELMTRPYRVSSGVRGLGWDKQTGYSSNRGDFLSPSAFGHGGFTGTVLWMDPELDLFFIFLSNRVHPDGRGSVNHLAGQILNRVVTSLVDTRVRPNPHPVWTGIDTLIAEDFRSLQHASIGLITNHTGRTREGVMTAQVLAETDQVDLRVLFSPEHGLAGKLDVPRIDDTQDATTGLQVFSLYGATRRPTPEMLQDIDTVVFDIQDIGTRFYTYISTMGEAMIAAAEQGKRFVVLDRPNPIDGRHLSGPMLDSGSESFVGFHSLPVRHGMTIGEIARMIRAERELDVELVVIPCQGWSREMSWEDTGLTWINPSPNMRNLTEAYLYPGIGLLETTNLSVGRGTDTPFEVLGAPWIDGRELARQLRQRRIPGIRFVPIEFTPQSSKYAQQPCGGVYLAVENRDRLDPVRVGLEIAVCLRQLYPDHWDTTNLNRLMGHAELYRHIVNASDIDTVLRTAAEGVAEFDRRRQPYLLYD